MKPEVSVVVITRNRGDELHRCIESILMQRDVTLELLVVDNGSTDNSQEILEGFSDPRIKLLPSKINLGVCGGRNRAFRHCSGSTIVIIDDDAEFLDANACRIVADYFSQHDQVGAIAFRIIDYQSGKIDRKFFPSKRKKRDKDTPFETSWVIGAGHAIRSTVLNQVGLYRDFRPYGSEEFDYSLRLFDAGWVVMYLPNVSVVHRESAKARIMGTDSVTLKLRHRLRAAYLNYPLPVFVAFLTFRSVITFYNSNLNGVAIWKAFGGVVKDICRLSSRRSPMAWSSVWRLIKLNGPVLF